MPIASVSPISFKGQEACSCQKKNGGAVPLIASSVTPGLGQYIDNRNKSAAKYFLGGLGSAAIGIAGATIRNIGIEKESATLAKLGGVAVLAGIVGYAINQVANWKDAYQGGNDRGMKLPKSNNKVDIQA